MALVPAIPGQVANPIILNPNVILQGASYLWRNRAAIRDNFNSFRDWVANEPYEHRADHRNMAAIRKRKRADDYDEPYIGSNRKKAKFAT